MPIIAGCQALECPQVENTAEFAQILTPGILMVAICERCDIDFCAARDGRKVGIGVGPGEVGQGFLKIALQKGQFESLS